MSRIGGSGKYILKHESIEDRGLNKGVEVVLSTISTQDMAKDTKQLLKCQRCGGQVLRLSGDINCLQCGAPYTKEGKLATYCAQELDNYLPSKRNIKIKFGA